MKVRYKLNDRNEINCFLCEGSSASDIGSVTRGTNHHVDNPELTGNALCLEKAVCLTHLNSIMVAGEMSHRLRIRLLF